MPAKACSDDEFIATFEKLGPTVTARKLRMDKRSVLIRRQRLEKRHKIAIKSPLGSGSIILDKPDLPDHIPLKIDNGVVLVGSDAHIWPGPRSTAIRAFLHYIKELRPKAIILNGDVLDFPRISRHAPIGWEKNPKPIEEIEAAQDILHDIEQAAGRGVRKIWPLGNHDARFESNIAQHCPEYALIHGIHLRDHFPQWEGCWMAIINNDVAVTHRFKGGIHAPHNNTLWAGMNFVTGHLHSQKADPITDLRGTRYGIDTGCLADIYAQCFRNYTEESPRNWIAGFGVFTFRSGLFMPPEFVKVMDKNHVAFRGELVKV